MLRLRNVVRVKEGERRIKTLPAYLRHLFIAGEILAMILNTIHNIRYYMRLMEKIRTALNEGNFLQFKNEFLTKKGGT